MVILGLAMASCGDNDGMVDNENAIKIKGAGSSFVAPLMQELLYNYNNTYGTKITYESTGSGTGMRQVGNHLVDFAISDVFMEMEKVTKYKVYQTPLFGSGLMIVANTKGALDDKSKEPLYIPINLIADIYSGKIKYWDNPRITRINTDHHFLHKRIIPIYRSDSSGTTVIFTSYLAVHDKTWRKKYGYGKTVRWPVGVGADGSSNIVNTLTKTKGSISYIGSPYHTKVNQVALTMVPLISDSGVAHIYSQYNLRKSLESLVALKIPHFGWHFDLYNSYSYDKVEGYPYYALESLIVNTQDPKKMAELQRFIKWLKTQSKVLKRYDILLMGDKYLQLGSTKPVKLPTVAMKE